MNHTRKTVLTRIFIPVGVLYLLLLIPPGDPPLPTAAGKRPFQWNQDDEWKVLEARFVEARARPCGELRAPIDSVFRECWRLKESLAQGTRDPRDSLFRLLEQSLFGLAPALGSCPDRVPEYLELMGNVRSGLKRQSAAWDLSSPGARSTLYRLLYGGRMAAEEVLLQAPSGRIPALAQGEPEPSRTPSSRILELTVHSGDILVSRGGAPTSALIARGNDYPGNFSHVALVHVDSATGVASIIESHIEKGVAVATVEEYLKDTKLRVMVLRLKAEHPRLRADPLLPHRVASLSLEQARSRHIPYDFAMDTADSGSFFCSEVVSAAYRRFGLVLWQGMSTISSPGVASWLAAFGVEHFETQEPSDLEYDPQLAVVAEWRDPATLFRDRVDNAVIDAMLERAERGERLGYDWYSLPLARVAKGYSAVLNMFGGIGPVPEGMDAAAALRHREFTLQHRKAQAAVWQEAGFFRRTKGYLPPYWELLSMARHAVPVYPVQ